MDSTDIFVAPSDQGETSTGGTSSPYNLRWIRNHLLRQRCSHIPGLCRERGVIAWMPYDRLLRAGYWIELTTAIHVCSVPGHGRNSR